MPPATALDPFDWYTAKLLRLKLDRFEAAAVKAEQLKSATDRNAAYWQRQFATLFRDAVGVEPEQRAELRSALGAVIARENTSERVAAIVERINANCHRFQVGRQP